MKIYVSGSHVMLPGKTKCIIKSSQGNYVSKYCSILKAVCTMESHKETST